MIALGGAIGTGLIIGTYVELRSTPATNDRAAEYYFLAAPPSPVPAQAPSSSLTHSSERWSMWL